MTKDEAQQCVACEGKPSQENNPCAVCGKPAQQEPVAIVAVDGVGQIQVGWITKPQHNDKLYTSPPAQRIWIGLTNKDINDLVKEFDGLPITLSYAIEAKLKEKNT